MSIHLTVGMQYIKTQHPYISIMSTCSHKQSNNDSSDVNQGDTQDMILLNNNELHGDEKFTIQQAFELLQDDGYKRHSKTICDNLDVSVGLPFESYIELIEQETEEWFNQFPSSLKKENSLAKPKSAMVWLLQQDGVIQHLGQDKCVRVQAKIENVWKNIKSRLSATRLSTPDGSTVLPYEVDDNDNTNQCDLPYVGGDIHALNMNNPSTPNAITPKNHNVQDTPLTSITNNAFCIRTNDPSVCQMKSTKANSIVIETLKAMLVQAAPHVSSDKSHVIHTHIYSMLLPSCNTSSCDETATIDKLKQLIVLAASNIAHEQAATIHTQLYTCMLSMI